jgi:hypothetical protein
MIDGEYDYHHRVIDVHHHTVVHFLDHSKAAVGSVMILFLFVLNSDHTQLYNDGFENRVTQQPLLLSRGEQIIIR